MKKLCRLAVPPAALILAMAAVGTANAQSTDGYHSIQVFPVVVDSTSYAQRFTIRNPDTVRALNVAVTYFPGAGTSQPSPLTCSPIAVSAGLSLTIASLRALCPQLAEGNQYGYIYLSENSAQNLPFAAFSRAFNPQGIGFNVEAFPAHTFTSADSVVTGIRRLAATSSAPAFQTNCFIGNLNDISPPTIPVETIIEYIISDESGTEIGRNNVKLVPGKLTRLVDVFAAANMPAGNYNDATIRFEELGSGEPGLMTFCTVQDNTSFGGDFRIGKQEQGFSTAYSSVGAQDDHVSRDSTVDSDMLVPGDVEARQFNIPAGAFRNTHAIYFRHPDFVQCEIIEPVSGIRATADYGLELRLVDQDGMTVIAGGNNSAGFGEVYLGDKTDRNDGANTRYSIQVESNGQNEFGDRPYRLHCQSGSGHSLGDIVRYNTPGVTF
ncbi:MAG: hypothetical protein H7147_03800 [Frankiaceae bacterium]|nr:hypothetical protein [Arenimonas sp.]